MRGVGGARMDRRLRQVRLGAAAVRLPVPVPALALLLLVLVLQLSLGFSFQPTWGERSDVIDAPTTHRLANGVAINAWDPEAEVEMADEESDSASFPTQTGLVTLDESANLMSMDMGMDSMQMDADEDADADDGAFAEFDSSVDADSRVDLDSSLDSPPAALPDESDSQTAPSMAMSLEQDETNAGATEESDSFTFTAPVVQSDSEDHSAFVEQETASQTAHEGSLESESDSDADADADADNEDDAESESDNELYANGTDVALAETSSKWRMPRINMGGRVEYTVTFRVFPRSRRRNGHWDNIISRGANDGDRTPGFWVFPNTHHVHYRHASTRSWNDGCNSLDELRPDRWNTVKACIKHNKAWIYINNVLSNFCDLGPNHHFTWGRRSNRLQHYTRYGGVPTRNSVKSFHWVQRAQPSSHIVVAKPNMRGPVQYTVDFEVYLKKGHVARGSWTNVWIRGKSQSDRTPGVWIFPKDTRMHFRHASTRSWNDGCNSIRQLPLNRWVPIRLVIHHNKAWLKIDNRLDNVCDIGTKHHFTWGSKTNDIWRYEPSKVHVRRFRWRNSSPSLPSGVPHPRFNRPVEYTLSYDTYIERKQRPWANLMLRGRDDGDRTPGMWLYPGATRVHFRHASTRTWNEGCDSSSNLPLKQWVNIKAVIKHNKAWLFINGRLDRLCELPKGHKYIWGKKSYGLSFGPQVNPGYAPTKIRNLKWRNHATPLPVMKPHFNRPVEYTMSVDVKYKPSRVGSWPNILLRGRDNSDRTPGLWQWGKYGHVHFRHASTRNWNDGFNCHHRLKPGQWTNIRVVIKGGRYAWMYWDGELDTFMDLGPKHHFTWGKKSLSFASAQAVAAEYASMETKNLYWSNQAESLPRALPQPDFKRAPDFTIQFEAKFAPKHGHWQGLIQRGDDRLQDRTCGVWVVPNSNQLHVRMSSTRTWNDGVLRTRLHAPINRWFHVKVRVKPRTMTVYINGRKSDTLTLPGRHRFKWPGHHLSLLTGTSIYSGYIGHQDVEVRKFRFDGIGHRHSRWSRSRKMQHRADTRMWGAHIRPKNYFQKPRHPAPKHRPPPPHQRVKVVMEKDKGIKVKMKVRKAPTNKKKPPKVKVHPIPKPKKPKKRPPPPKPKPHKNLAKEEEEEKERQKQEEAEKLGQAKKDAEMSATAKDDGDDSDKNGDDDNDGDADRDAAPASAPCPSTSSSNTEGLQGVTWNKSGELHIFVHEG